MLQGRTILSFAEPSLQVVEREVAHLILQAVEIHGRGWLTLRCPVDCRGGGSGGSWAQLGSGALGVSFGLQDPCVIHVKKGARSERRALSVVSIGSCSFATAALAGGDRGIVT